MLCTRLTNARFLAMDPDHPVAHDLGIWRGRIVGLDEAATSLPAREVIDLQGATVLPGFIDAHAHLAWTGLKADTVSIAGCTRIEDVLAVVAQAADRAGPPGGWLSIAGYDQRALGRHLTAAELDTVSAGRKVFLLHDSGHGCVVNSAVLDLLPAGIPHENGFLAEGAMGAARSPVPSPATGRTPWAASPWARPRIWSYSATIPGASTARRPLTYRGHRGRGHLCRRRRGGAQRESPRLDLKVR